MAISKELLLEKIEEKYGDLNSPIGCYAGNNEWLSVKEIVSLIEECPEED